MTSDRHRPTRSAALALLGVLLALSGCNLLPMQRGGELTAQSLSHPGRTLRGGFTRAYYTAPDEDTLTVVLLAGPPEQPEQALTVRMFWRPRAGRTPIDPAATNATVQYVIFTDPATPDTGPGEVGVYSGAGFLFPRDTPGSARLAAGLWDANLRLRDRSVGFGDLLGQAQLEGEFLAVRDDQAVSTLLHRLSAMVSERLQYPRLVDATPVR